MPRILIATVAGLAGFVAYVAFVITLADRLPPGHTAGLAALQFLYFVVVGTAWVIPARGLMYWAAGRTR